jgi:hypothetical protein
MLDDSDIHSTRHARTLVGGVLAGVIDDTMLYVSGGAEHQGPAGGGPVAIIGKVSSGPRASRPAHLARLKRGREPAKSTLLEIHDALLIAPARGVVRHRPMNAFEIWSCIGFRR